MFKNIQKCCKIFSSPIKFLDKTYLNLNISIIKINIVFLKGESLLKVNRIETNYKLKTQSYW